MPLAARFQEDSQTGFGLTLLMRPACGSRHATVAFEPRDLEG